MTAKWQNGDMIATIIDSRRVHCIIIDANSYKSLVTVLTVDPGVRNVYPLELIAKAPIC